MRIPLLAASWLATLLVCLPPAAQAAEVLQLEPVVVRSTRPAFPLQPQRLTVIPADEIQRSGAINLAQLLEDQPGLSVRAYGALGALSTLTMRGAPGEGILVLRDGVKLNSPERGGVDLSAVSLLGVKQVEILHGAASGLYGAEAVGGVINLISAEAPVRRLETGIGTWGFRTFVAELASHLGETRASFGLRRNAARNDFPYVYRDAVATRVNDALDGTELWVGLDRPDEAGRLKLDLAFNHLDKELPGPVNFPSPQAKQLTTQAQGSLRWSRWLQPHLEQTFTLSHLHARLHFADPLSIHEKEAHSLLDSTDLQAQWLWLSEGHELRLGGGMKRDRVIGDRVGSRERTQASAFAHETWFLTPELTAFGNLRLDRHAGFGLEASPRLGFTYQVAAPLRLRGAVGRAYRAPTFNDLYWPQLGNPALRPERTEVYEVGLDAQEGAWRLEGTAFFNRGLDTILWQPGAGGDWTPLNAGRTETRGIETKLEYRVTEQLILSGGGTWLAAIDASSTGPTAGKALIYRPSLVADGKLTYRPWEALSVSVGWAYTGERFTTAQNTDSMPAHELWSAGLSYAFDERNTLSLRGENLLNRYYQLQPYYPMPGRIFTASWSLRF